MIYKTSISVELLKETSVKLISEAILEMRTPDYKNVKQRIAKFRKF